MSNEKTYTCVCGRVFNNPQAFNGHKSHCIKHNIEKYGSTEYLKSVETRRHSDAQAKTIVSTYKRKKEEKLQAWISENTLVRLAEKFSHLIGVRVGFVPLFVLDAGSTVKRQRKEFQIPLFVEI